MAKDQAQENRAVFLIAGTVAATALVVRSRDAPVPVRATVRHPQLRVGKIVKQAPPLVGRIQINYRQLQQAEAAGMVDRPVKTILDVPTRMTYGEYVWNDRGVPAGPVWVRVDLSSQLLSVFRSGHEIGTSVILYAADGLPTPTGKFSILAKWKDHKSATYGDAPMPYTLRLTNDGVSIHGSNVRWGFATHGCIGVPKEFAAKLFDVLSKGDDVLIVSGGTSSTTASVGHV